MDILFHMVGLVAGITLVVIFKLNWSWGVITTAAWGMVLLASWLASRFSCPCTGTEEAVRMASTVMLGGYYLALAALIVRLETVFKVLMVIIGLPIAVILISLGIS